MKKPDSGSLVERIEDIERGWTKHQIRLDNLERMLERLRHRLHALLPERTYCPHCKALISELSVVCGSCGRQLKVPENPKAGQPR